MPIYEIEGKPLFKKLTIQAAKGGWIVAEPGKPAEVFVRWDAVVRKLERELTSKGDESSA